MQKEQDKAVEVIQDEVMGKAPLPATEGGRKLECASCGHVAPEAEFEVVSDEGEMPDVEVEVEVTPEEVTTTPKATSTPMTAKDAARKAMEM